MARLHSTGSENTEYIPLMENGHATKEVSSPDDNINYNPRNFRTLAILVLTAFLTSYLSFFFSGTQFLSARRSLQSRRGISELRRPSLYIGLDKVYLHSTTNNSSENMVHHDHNGSSPSGDSTDEDHGRLHPHKIISINSQDPDVTFYLDRWILLSKQDRVFMEFNLPTGSHSCDFALYLPARRSLGDRMLTLEGKDPAIDIEIFSSSMNISEITWSNRPTGGTKLVSLAAEFDSNATTKEFPCVGKTSLIVGLSCAKEDCRVEYQDAVKQPLLGIYMVVL
ncbi:hypothetical protein BDQ12DRAFT_739502 [Crucibulum laeve]|uniref:Ubiquitin 3 binding protein But2 C-terminal domain-containing protein n=1 Tax=Crucibulum laeve TaxID=68775 RepID=A0A5C3LHD5_9AGAR|nr:hypothetical protein BDQ12DRAFT_739502 [Crucibulum laeve]